MRVTVRGRPYVEWVEPVEQLKREGKHDEALMLLLECIEAAEHDRHGYFPAPWYTWQAAIIYRRQKNYGAEVRVLERWTSFSSKVRPAAGSRASKMQPRMEKARELMAKQKASDRSGI